MPPKKKRAMKNKSFIDLILAAFDKEIIKKLVFSRPRTSEIAKISARLVAHRGRKMLVLESSLPGNTVSHKNLLREEIEPYITPLLEEYRQANLITTLGDVEWKISTKGSVALLGADKLERRMSGEEQDFERAIGSLDKVKNHILNGNEDFLIKLGVSDSRGRVHDKRQGKFRQINRFLEHIEGIYGHLGAQGDILIYDLCCGKSYLSFAVYYYLTQIKGRRVKLVGIDLKRDVIDWCASLARELGYVGMSFIYDDVRNTPRDVTPDMVISLHACDVATDIVINSAISLGAKVILSTPCCHRYLNDRIAAEELSFVTRFPQLKNKLCEAITDAIRLSRLEASGYSVAALELTDPDDTPKNTLLRAVKIGEGSREAMEEYERILGFVLGEGKVGYLEGL